ncbi:MAG: phospholipid/cholesterol/gamma-HCH transport system substrate-binding protein [Mycobacterium sp.]|jgi:virulence factor Mce-like protein|nr:phospholipid/cholesterol/gamma-HCH transport system substrate-binding protein [Mycobacterium sp.]
MMRRAGICRSIVVAACAATTATACSFQGLNSLPLPGAEGRGSDAHVYHVEITNVGTLESNSPVMINDVVVGSVRDMTVGSRDGKWFADVDLSVKPDTVVPKNAVASVGQTSLLGSMHLSLDPPLGQTAQGSLPAGSKIPLSQSSTYPSTEQTLSSLSLVVNAGGLSQLGDILHNFNGAVHGREQQIRDLLTRLDTFVGTLAKQRDDIISTIKGLNRLAGAFAEQRDVINNALDKIPPALDVLVKERPNITAALTKLGTFSDTATRLANDTQADLVRNLKNLAPTLKALTDLDKDLAPTLAYATLYPYGTTLIDRAVRGDYANLFAVLDISRERLKRTLLLGTRFGQPGAVLPGAPGEPYIIRDMLDPAGGSAASLSTALTPPKPDAAPGSQPAPLTQQSAPDAPPAPPPLPETPWPPSQMDVGG